MVLMKDIAEAVGVSNATVSLVLGGKSGSRVSESVKNKVLQTAKEMGYHSNDLARRDVYKRQPQGASEPPRRM